MTAVAGALSEWEMFKHLEKHFKNIKCQGDDGRPDFLLSYAGRDFLIEHKRASKDPYANGDVKVELQKWRPSIDAPENRYYPIDHFDIVSVDVSRHTGVENDFRFAKAANLRTRDDYPDRLHSCQRFDLSDNSVWKDNLQNILEAKD